MVQRSKPWILMVALLVGIFFPLCAPLPRVLSKPCSILRSTGAEMAQSWNVLRSGPVALWPGGSVTRWPGGPVARWPGGPVAL